MAEQLRSSVLWAATERFSVRKRLAYFSELDSSTSLRGLPRLQMAPELVIANFSQIGNSFQM